MNRGKLGFFFICNFFFICVLYRIDYLTDNQELAQNHFAHKKKNCPKINGRIIEHEETNAMVKNAG